MPDHPDQKSEAFQSEHGDIADQQGGFEGSDGTDDRSPRAIGEDRAKANRETESPV